MNRAYRRALAAPEYEEFSGKLGRVKETNALFRSGCLFPKGLESLDISLGLTEEELKLGGNVERRVGFRVQ